MTADLTTEQKKNEESDELKKNLENAKADVVAIKKQAENQQDMVSKLLEENKSLKNRLADYTDVLGDLQKKKV